MCEARPACMQHLRATTVHLLPAGRRWWEWWIWQRKSSCWINLQMGTFCWNVCELMNGFQSNIPKSGFTRWLISILQQVEQLEDIMNHWKIPWRQNTYTYKVTLNSFCVIVARADGHIPSQGIHIVTKKRLYTKNILYQLTGAHTTKSKISYMESYVWCTLRRRAYKCVYSQQAQRIGSWHRLTVSH